MNLKRYESETRAEYRDRQSTAQAAADRAALAGPFKPVGTKTGRELFRQELRMNGTMRKHAGAYGRGLRNWCNRVFYRSQLAT